MKRIDERLSQKIANMSLVCAFLVVLLHCGVRANVGTVSWWVLQLTQDGIGCIAVPYFFLVSGYFLAMHTADVQWWIVSLRTRAITLLVPYCFWCFFGFAFINAVRYLAAWLSGNSFQFGCEFSCARFTSILGLDFLVRPVMGHLWFVRTLLLLVVASPIIVYFVKKTKLLFPILMYLLAVFVFHDPGNHSCIGGEAVRYFLSPIAFAYFSFGVYLQRYSFPSINLGGLKFAIVLMLASCLVGYKAYLSSNTILCDLGVLELATPLIMFCVWRLIPCGFVTKCTRDSFAVYVMHPLLIYFFSFLYRLPFSCESIALILAVVSFAMCIVVAECLRRYLPKIHSFVFGGR